MESLATHVSEQVQVPHSLINSCFQLLRPLEPKPPPRLAKNGRLLDEAETHANWCRAFAAQSDCPNPYDERYGKATKTGAKSMVGQAWSHRGLGLLDGDISQVEFDSVVSKWKASKALPPDLIPRIVFSVGDKVWNSVSWLVVRLSGPGCLAMKPCLWRESCVVPLYKSGCVGLRQLALYRNPCPNCLSARRHSA